MENKKIEQAIRYILRHPVQFNAKYNDRCILSDSVTLRTDFDNYIRHNQIQYLNISVQKLAQIIWEYYHTWCKKPHGTKSEYNSMLALQSIVDDILFSAIHYIKTKPEEFGAHKKMLDEIQHNKSFRKTVHNKIEHAPKKYENMAQSKSAEFIWRLYEDWAY